MGFWEEAKKAVIETGKTFVEGAKEVGSDIRDIYRTGKSYIVPSKPGIVYDTTTGTVYAPGSSADPTSPTYTAPTPTYTAPTPTYTAPTGNGGGRSGGGTTTPTPGVTIPTSPGLITPPTTAPTPDKKPTPTPSKSVTLAQQRYIASLRSGATDLEVQPYRGVGFDVRAPKDIKFFEPQFGTISAEAPTGVKEVSAKERLKEKEFFDKDISKPINILYQEQADKVANKIIAEEAQKANKEVKDAVKTLQNKIDKGELTLNEAQDTVSRIEKAADLRLQNKVTNRFDKEISTAYKSEDFKSKVKKAEQFRGQYAEFDPTFVKERTKKRLETALDIGVGLVSAAAPQVGIAYFAGKGIYGASKGRKEDIRMAEVDPITGKLITPRYMGEIPSEESQKAGASLLFAGMSGVAQVGKIGTAIDKQTAKELAEKAWYITGREMGEEGGEQVLRVYATKSVPRGSATAKLTLPIKVTKEGKFKILAGRGKVNTQITNYMKKGIVKEGDEIMKGSLDFNVFGRGTVSKGFIRTDMGNLAFKDLGLKVTQGEGYISPDTLQNIKTTVVRRPKRFGLGMVDDITVRADVATKPEIFKFGGISTQADDATSVISGKLSKARLYPREGRVTGIFKPEAYGKILGREIKEEVAEKGLKTFTGGGTKSSKEFFKKLYSTVPEEKIPGRVPSITRPSVTPKPTTVPTRPSGLISKYTGTGQYELTETIGRQAAPSILSSAEGMALRTSLKTPALFDLTTKFIQPTLVAGKDLLFKQDMLMDEGLLFKKDLRLKKDLLLKQEAGLKSDMLFKQDILVDQVFRTPTKQITKTVTQPAIRGAAPGIIPPVTTVAPTLTPVAPSFISPSLISGRRRGQAKVVKEQGYNAYAFKADVSGKKKYQKINTIPLTKESALSTMAREVDNTISARGKIEKIKQQVQQVQDVAGKIRYKRKPQIALNTKDKYWKNNSEKFRSFKTKKKIALPTGVVIERQKYRLDSPMEVGRIQAAKRSTIGLTGTGVKKSTKKRFRL